MMQRNMELPVFVGGREYKAFLQEGFFNDRVTTGSLHDHGMAEIHLQIAGKADYRLGDTVVTLLPDTILLIPAGVFHRAIDPPDDVRHVAYQVPLGKCRENTVRLPSGTLERVWILIGESAETGKADRLSACLSQFCAELVGDGGACRLTPAQNREVVVRDFFSRRYAEDVTLETLAEELNLSPKQTARLVRRFCGQTFGQKLAAQRREIAARLIESGTMSLSEVAEAVGYRTYSGFWKAFRR